MRRAEGGWLIEEKLSLSSSSQLQACLASYIATLPLLIFGSFIKTKFILIP